MNINIKNIIIAMIGVCCAVSAAWGQTYLNFAVDGKIYMKTKHNGAILHVRQNRTDLPVPLRSEKCGSDFQPFCCLRPVTWGVAPG